MENGRYADDEDEDVKRMKDGDVKEATGRSDAAVAVGETLLAFVAWTDSMDLVIQAGRRKNCNRPKDWVMMAAPFAKVQLLLRC